jgi:hypothetical protein
MSAGQSEPEKYSIDEMMERLKNASSEAPESGELVTRADGTQAVRVRKRKRRSTQPHKQDVQRTKRTRIVQVAAALVLLFLSLLAIGAGLVFANSSQFRQSLLEKISDSTGADAKFITFRMNPKTANAGGLDLKWPAGNVLNSLTLRNLVADVSPLSFFGSSFGGDELSVAHGVVALQAPQSGEPTRIPAHSNGQSSVRFNRYQIQDFHAVVGEPATPALTLAKSEASMVSNGSSKDIQLRLYKGELTIPGWPKLRLDRALVEFQQQDTKLIQFRVLHEKDDRGHLDLAGVVTPFSSDRDSKLTVALESFPLNSLLGNSFGRLVSGRVRSHSAPDSNFLTLSPKGAAASVFDVTFTATPGSSIDLQGFQFLSILAKQLQDDWFERPNFDEDSNGVVHRENGMISLRAIDLESKGKLAIKGILTQTAAGTLAGRLQVGLTEPFLMTSKAPHFDQLFGATEDGYRWLTLDIGGTTTAPTDNFAKLLAESQANPQERLDLNESKVPSFEDLIRLRDQ